MRERVNIVQAEFFFTRSRSKSAVRLLDHSGNLTQFARRMQHYQQLRYRLIRELQEKRGWRRTLCAWRVHLLANKLVDMPVWALRLVGHELETAWREERDIAIEQADRSFRLARKDEVRAFLLDAEYASSVWLFVFEPDELCANPVKSVAYAM